jgi:hypothetical protein
MEDRMAIVVKDTGGEGFEPAPPGPHAVVCCDVADLGMQDTQWGPKDMVRIYWMLEDLMDDGRPYLVAQNYTASLSSKANLRRDLEAWRGKAFNDDELRGFDLEILIGVPAYINVVHNVSKKNGRTYANLASIMPMPKGITPPTIDPNYKRWKDRQGAEEPEAREDDPPPPGDDDIPF